MLLSDCAIMVTAKTNHAPEQFHVVWFVNVITYGTNQPQKQNWILDHIEILRHQLSKPTENFVHITIVPLRHPLPQ